MGYYAEDMTGQCFGSWTVLSRAANRNDHPAWNCRCSCGTTSVVLGVKLRNGTSTACRACAARRRGDSMIEDLTGRRFGRWTVLALSKGIRASAGSRQARWVCRCTCGAESVVPSGNLKRGLSTGCGSCSARFGKA